MYLDGKVNPVKRQAIVEEFRQSQTRVLVFSSVGGTGLNLAFASVVILLVSLIS
jgi:SNF2 family DNA or RNA helicase